MEKSSDLESQLAKAEENIVLILESINKGKEEAKFSESKRLDVEVRLDFIEKLARKIKVVAFKEKDEINPQLLSKKLSKLRIDCAPEEEKEELKLDKRFEDFELKSEKQLEDQQKLNEELKKELGQLKKKQKKFDQYLAPKKATSSKKLSTKNTCPMKRILDEISIDCCGECRRLFMLLSGFPGRQNQQRQGGTSNQKKLDQFCPGKRAVGLCLPLDKKARFRTGGVSFVPFEQYVHPF